MSAKCESNGFSAEPIANALIGSGLAEVTVERAEATLEDVFIALAGHRSE